MYQIGTQDRIELYDIITSGDDLYNHLRVALGVEIAVIPPYLLGYYSLRDKNGEAARIMSSVVMEEMLHIALNANLINAIGRRVVIGRREVPHHYPCHIPYHAPQSDGSPYAIHLQPISLAVARDLYMLIETPSPFVQGGPSQPQGNDWDTLGQFYQAIVEGFENVAKADPGLFSGDPRKQYSISSLYNGGGYLYPVTNLEQAVRAIRENQQQTQGRRNDPYQPYGCNGALELGHYFRFRQIADGKVPLGEVYPVRTDITLEHMEGVTRAIAELFNQAYTLLLKSLEGVFNTQADYTRFNGVSRLLMGFVLDPLADILVRRPIGQGEHAGPCFDFDLGYPDVMAAGSFAYIDLMIGNCERIAVQPTLGDGARPKVRKVLQVLRSIRRVIAGRHNWDAVAGHAATGGV